MAKNLWNLCKELQKSDYKWVDLTHSLNNKSPFWSGIPAGSVNLGMEMSI